LEKHDVSQRVETIFDVVAIRRRGRALELDDRAARYAAPYAMVSVRIAVSKDISPAYVKTLYRTSLMMAWTAVDPMA
jgi:hypothetical protein